MKVKFEYLDSGFNKKSAVLDFNDENEFNQYLKEEKYTLIHHKKVFFEKSKANTKNMKDFISSLYFLIKANINILDALLIIKENFPEKFKDNINKTISHLKKVKI